MINRKNIIVIAIIAIMLMGSIVLSADEENIVEYKFVKNLMQSSPQIYINGVISEEDDLMFGQATDQKWISTTTTYANGGVSSITVVCKGTGTGCNIAKEIALFESF